MRMTRTRLVEIVHEEIQGRINELLEAEDDSSKKKKGAKGVSADTESDPKRSKSAAADPVGAPDASMGVDDLDDQPPGDEETGADEAPPDTAVDDAEGASSSPTGQVADEVSGKTIQSMTIEPRSRVLPGAKEVILTFNETTDPLRILVTATGTVKFWYRGALHDLP